MGVNSFLDNETTVGSFDANAADLWLRNKTTIAIEPTPSHDYVNAYEKAQLLSISGKDFTYMVVSNASGTNFTGNIVCNDLTVNGTNTIINTTNLAVNDPLVAIGTGNTTTDAVDLGQFGYYNSGGQKYFSIFRDASDSGIVKVVHGLTNAPSGTVIDLTNAVKSTVQVGTLDCTGITISGTSVSATGTDLNKVAGITNGSAIASKAMVLDSSLNISGCNRFVASAIHVGSDLRFRSAIPVMTAIDIYDFTFQSTNNINGTPIETLTTRAIFYGASNAGIIGCNGLQALQTGANLEMKSPVLFSAVGTSASGNLSINTGGNSAIYYITPLTKTVTLTATNGARTLDCMTPSGTLLQYQEVRLLNKTSTYITLGHRAMTGPGVINAYWYRLYPNQSINMMYDNALTGWTSTSLDPDMFNFRTHRWAGDDALNQFVNSNFNHHVKINCGNISGSVSINNVSGWDIHTSALVSGSNWQVINVSGSILSLSSSVGFVQTEVQSSKFAGFVYNFDQYTFLTFNLTRNNYYMFVIMAWDTDGNNFNRSIEVTDVYTGKKISVSLQQFTTNAAGSPGIFVSYIFRQDFGTQRAFYIRNLSFAQINGYTVINLGDEL